METEVDFNSSVVHTPIQKLVYKIKHAINQI